MQIFLKSNHEWVPWSNQELTNQLLLQNIQIGKDVKLLDQVFIERSTVLNEGVVLGSGVALGSYVRVGKKTRIQPNCRLDSWVTVNHDSLICQNTRIQATSSIGHSVTIGENCILGPHVTIGDKTWIAANIVIPANAILCAGTRVDLPEDFIVMGPLGRGQRMLTFSRNKYTIFAATGYFRGTLKQFETKVRRIHGNSHHGKEYLAAIKYAKAKFAIKD